jgi:hypothetical protein
MPFRGAIRRLPQSVVDEFLSQPVSPALAEVPHYKRYLLLIRFDPLPRPDDPPLRFRSRAIPGSAAAEADELAAAIRKWREEERRESLERRQAEKEAARLRKVARQAKVPIRRAESERRKALRRELATMPLALRIQALISNPGLPAMFFEIHPEEMDDNRLSAMDAARRAALSERIACMRDSGWRKLHARLQDSLMS